MSEQKKQLSALIDGELDVVTTLRLLDQIQSEEGLRRAWSRIHLTAHAIRGELVRAEYNQIGDRVRERLADEPTVLAARAGKNKRPSWTTPLVSSALAASLALVAVFALPPIFEQQSAPQTARRISPSPELYVQLPGSTWDLDKPAVESKLNRFLVNHQEYAPASRMQGLLPYATFVSYDSRR